LPLPLPFDPVQGTFCPMDRRLPLPLPFDPVQGTWSGRRKNDRQMPVTHFGFLVRQ